MVRSTRYELVREIGRGGFGTVWRARARGGVVRDVALKILHPDLARREDVVARLRVEARVLSLLRHRATVKVEDLVRLPEGWAVVLEYVDGVDLRDLLGLGRVPPHAVVELGIEVAGALAEAHAARDPETGRPLGFVHRDVKPENLRLTAAGACKVLDFGVAHAEFDDRASSATTRIFGSHGYLAPERLEFRDLPAGDVFALGVVMAEALLGRRTGQGAIVPDRHAAWVEALRAEIEPGDLRDLVAEMLAYEPERRPTAAEVERRLEAMAVAGPSLRQWASEAVPAAIAIEPGRTATHAATARPRRRMWPWVGAAAGVAGVLLATRMASGEAPAVVAVRPPEPEPAVAPAPVSEPAPAPVSEPAPAAPRKVVHARAAPVEPVAAAPEAAPLPAPRAAPTGTVRATGGATLRLIGANGTWPEGAVPAGTYRIEYGWGDGRVRAPSAPLVVAEGATVEVRCDAVSELCRW